MRSTSGSRTVRVLAIAAAAAAVSLAGCGGGGGNGSAAATNASADGGDTDAFRDCLKEHGVDLPDNFGQGGPGQGQRPSGEQPPSGGQPPSGERGGGPRFGNDPEMQEAFNACQDKAPTGGFGGARNSEQFQAYTSCLRDHGVDVSDPSSSTSTSTGQPTRPSFDRDDPDFAAANEACQALLPTSTTTTTVQP